MPAVDLITKSDQDTVAKLKSPSGFSGLTARTPTVGVRGSTVIGVDTSKNPALYVSTATKKTKIVLHGTVGTLASDLPTLTAQRQMTCHYIVARDGTILEIYNPEWWAYHLGKGCVGGNGILSQHSIAIEISNYGPLDYKNKGGGDKFYNVYGGVYGDGNQRVDDIGNIGGSDATVVKLQNAYRGYRYYAALTSAQYTAVNNLVSMLCAKFDIPKHTIEYASKFSVFPDDDTAKNYQGICTHVNFRPEGKWDLGPWVDWDRITGLANDKVDYVDENPEEVKGMKTQATERYDGSQDNWEYKDTVDPISGEVVETAEAKKMRVLRENNPLICAW